MNSNPEPTAWSELFWIVWGIGSIISLASGFFVLRYGKGNETGDWMFWAMLVFGWPIMFGMFAIAVFVEIVLVVSIDKLVYRITGRRRN